MSNGLPYSRPRTYIPGVTKVVGADVDNMHDLLVVLRNSGANLGRWGDAFDGAPVCDNVNVFPWATQSTYLVDGIHRYVMHRDIYVTDITVTGANVAIDTNGFRIYHRGKAKATGGAVGFICNGLPGANLADLGTGAANGTLLGGGAGGNGAAAAAGGAGGAVAVSLGGLGGAGGAGPAHAGGAAGVIITNAAEIALNPGLRIYSPHLFGYLAGAGFGGAFAGNVAVLTPICGGSGGGAGGDAGGQGGGGAGVLAMAGLELELDTRTQVQAKGGAGAAGTGANSGGGGGGGGGGMMLAHCLITILDGTVLDETINCAGGALGAGTGTGVAGAAGANGHMRLLTQMLPFTPASSANLPMMLPNVYATGAEPDPATMAIGAVICITFGPDTQGLFINRDGTAWKALS